MQVEIVENLERFLELKDIWNSALLNSDIDSVCMRYEWFKCWWEAFGEDFEMFTVIFREKGKVLAIAPLMISTIKLKGIPCRALTFMSNGLSPRCNIILIDRHKETMAELLNVLVQHSKRWQIAILDNMLGESVATKELLSCLEDKKMKFVQLQARLSPFTKIENSWDDYYNSLPKNHRRNLRRSKNRISREGELKVERTRDKEELGSALERCFQISKRSWKGPLRKDLGGREARAKFFKELTKVAGEQGWADIWLLTINNQDAAFEYLLLYKRKVLSLTADYDLKCAWFSPGEILTLLFLKELFKEKDKEYDFSGTIYDYKMNWTDSVRNHILLWIFNKRFSSKLFYFIKVKLLPSLSSLGNLLGKSKATKDRDTARSDGEGGL